MLCVLLSLSAFTACVGRLSVEEYAEECGEWWDNHEHVLGPGEGLKVRYLEDALEDWNALDPPGEVSRAHEVWTEALELKLKQTEVMDSLEDKLDDMDDLSEDIEDAAERGEPTYIRGYISEEVDDLRDEYNDQVDDLYGLIKKTEGLASEESDASDDLPRRVRRKLEEGRCL